MAGSIYGNIFRISTWGESHGKGVGVVVDGCPAGIPIPKYFGLYNNDQLAFTKNKSNNETYYRNMTDLMPKASRCIGCGKCERACPQNVKVIEGLKKVVDRFENKK